MKISWEKRVCSKKLPDARLFKQIVFMSFAEIINFEFQRQILFLDKPSLPFLFLTNFIPQKRGKLIGPE